MGQALTTLALMTLRDCDQTQNVLRLTWRELQIHLLLVLPLDKNSDEAHRWTFLLLIVLQRP